MSIDRTTSMEPDMIKSNPRDPNQVGIATMNMFISSYVSKALGANSVELVVADTIMCTNKGEATFSTINPDPDMSTKAIVKMNMHSLAGVLLSYNMSLSVLRFEVIDGQASPGLFMDPDVIEMMRTGKFMNDPAFVYRIRNGLPLVSDRAMMLAKGNVIRRTRKIMRTNSSM